MPAREFEANSGIVFHRGGGTRTSPYPSSPSMKRTRSSGDGTRQARRPNIRYRLRAIISYTASRRGRGTRKNTAANFHMPPSSRVATSAAFERNSTSSPRVTKTLPGCPSSIPWSRHSSLPREDWSVPYRMRTSGSRRIRKSTKPLHRLHSPSNQTTTRSCRFSGAGELTSSPPDIPTETQSRRGPPSVLSTEMGAGPELNGCLHRADYDVHVICSSITVELPQIESPPWL